MSASTTRKGIPSGLLAALLLSAIAPPPLQRAAPSDRPKREGSEDDGDIDIERDIDAALTAMFDGKSPRAFFGFDLCSDPTCEACHVQPAPTATAASTAEKPPLRPVFSPRALRAVDLKDTDSGRVLKVKQLLAEAVDLIDAPTNGDEARINNVAISHVSTAALWVERAING